MYFVNVARALKALMTVSKATGPSIVSDETNLKVPYAFTRPVHSHLHVEPYFLKQGSVSVKCISVTSRRLELRGPGHQACISHGRHSWFISCYTRTKKEIILLNSSSVIHSKILIQTKRNILRFKSGTLAHAIPSVLGFIPVL